MKKALLISVLFSFSLLNTNAQITFQKTVSTGWDAGGIAINDSDGGYIMAGYSPVFLLKTDLNGTMLWHKSFFNTGDDEWDFSSVIQTNDGGYLLAGSTSIYVEGISDAFLIKTDDYGNLIWCKTYGGEDDDYVRSLQNTDDGCYILTGYTYSFGAGLKDVFLLKIDPNGILLWSKTYGSINDDMARSVYQTMDGGYIIAGGTVMPETGITAVYLIKTDSLGNEQWSKSFERASNSSGKSILQTSDGGFTILSLGIDIHLIRTDSIGSLLWNKTYGNILFEYSSSFKQTADGGYIIIGSTNSFGSGWEDSDVYLIKTKADGSMEWSRSYGDELSDGGISVWPASDGGYILAGFARSFSFIFNSSDCYLIKTDSNGYTGCYLSTPATVVNTVAFVSAEPTTITTTPDFVSTTHTLNNGTNITMTNLCSTVGSEEVENKNSFRLSPNPSTNSITITLPSTTPKTNISVTIYNVNAQQVISRRITDPITVLDIGTLPGGVYFVRITTDRTVMVGKFMKQ